MTPERIEEIKQAYDRLESIVTNRPEYRVEAMTVLVDMKLLLAALEESQQCIGKLELYVKSLEFNRDDTQKRANEKLRERDTELVEAQQTIARQQEAMDRASDMMNHKHPAYRLLQYALLPAAEGSDKE